MKWDRQMFILGVSKAFAYLLNTIIICALLAVVGGFGWGLYIAITE